MQWSEWQIIIFTDIILQFRSFSKRQDVNLEILDKLLVPSYDFFWVKLKLTLCELVKLFITISFSQGFSLSFNSLDYIVNRDFLFKLALKSRVNINFYFERILISLLDFFYQDLSIVIYLGLDQMRLKVIIILVHLLLCFSFLSHLVIIVFWICHIGSVL